MKYIVLFLVVTLGYLQAQTSWNCPPSANPCPADTVKACANTNQFITDQVYNTLIAEAARETCLQASFCPSGINSIYNLTNAMTPHLNEHYCKAFNSNKTVVDQIRAVPYLYNIYCNPIGINLDPSLTTLC